MASTYWLGVASKWIWLASVFYYQGFVKRFTAWWRVARKMFCGRLVIKQKPLVASQPLGGNRQPKSVFQTKRFETMHFGSEYGIQELAASRQQKIWAAIVFCNWDILVARVYGCIGWDSPAKYFAGDLF